MHQPSRPFPAPGRARWIRGVWLPLLLLALLLSGCTSLRVVEPRAEARRAARVGEEVRVRRQDGTVRQFVVTAVDPVALHGADDSVAFADITELRVRRFDGWRTAGCVAWVVGAAIVAAVLANPPIYLPGP